MNLLWIVIIMTNSITQNALRALLYEVATQPKPGLVDPVSSGPHPDMDIYTFIDSSLSLESYLKAAEMLGQTFRQDNLTDMFFELRQKGLAAEQEMYAATDNINTHKGAIFALGIFVCAESYAQTQQAELFTTIRQMCTGLVEHDLNKNNNLQTAGTKTYQKYGYGGARQEAQNGYPIVEQVALPFLKKRTGCIQTRILDTLMKIASVAIDSNLIKRAGGDISAVTWVQEQAKKYLALGGYQTVQGKEFLLAFNQEMTDKNYSLGGCADLLIVTIFVALERNYL